MVLKCLFQPSWFYLWWPNFCLFVQKLPKTSPTSTCCGKKLSQLLMLFLKGCSKHKWLKNIPLKHNLSLLQSQSMILTVKLHWHHSFHQSFQVGKFRSTIPLMLVSSKCRKPAPRTEQSLCLEALCHQLALKKIPRRNHTDRFLIFISYVCDKHIYRLCTLKIHYYW